MNLKWSEFDGEVLRLTRTKTGPRTVWLSGAARAVLDRQPRIGSPYVFPSPLDPARSCHREVQLWYRARKEAGIEDVRLHDLRHTVASQAVARGAALSTVARMLGHTDPKMTLRYAHVGDREIKAAAERIGQAIAYAMNIGRAVGRSAGRPAGRCQSMGVVRRRYLTPENKDTQYVVAPISVQSTRRTTIAESQRTISAIAFCNRGIVFDIQLKTAAESLRTIAGDPRHVRVRIGEAVVLHTSDQKLLFHRRQHRCGCVVESV